MKHLLLAFGLTWGLTACAWQTNSPDSQLEQLKATLAYGCLIELNTLDPQIEKDLLARLYQLPIMENDCFIETHGICQNQYLLTVSSYDEQPEINIYPLHSRGEIAAIAWRKAERLDSIELRITLNKYTAEALQNNKALKNEVSHINLSADLQTAREQVE